MLGFTPLASAPLADSGVQAEEFSISADAGTFTTTVQTASFTVTLAAAHGSFTHTGQDSDLNKDLIVAADVGSFTLAGQNADVNAEFNLAFATGIFTTTGQDLQISLDNAFGSGEFVLTGRDVQFALSMVAERGIFAFSGFPHFKIIEIDGRHVVLSYSGQDSVFSTSFPVDHAAFTATGFDVDLVNVVTADTGSFTVVGQDAELSANLSLPVDLVSFSIAGQDATFVVQRSADVGSFATVGQTNNFDITFPVDVTSNPSNATTVNYDVTVATGTNEYGSGNKYYIDGVLSPTLQLMAGVTYRFKQDSNTNSNHPLRFSTTPNGTHGGGSEYTTGVVTNGVPGEAGSYTEITPTATTPRLFAYCINHSGMGFQASINGGLHVLAGQDALKGISEAAAAVSFSLTGQDVSFAVQISLIVDSVSFTFIGRDIDLKFVLNRVEFNDYKQQTVFDANPTIELTTESINSVDIQAVDQNELEVYSLTENSVTISKDFNEAA